MKLFMSISVIVTISVVVACLCGISKGLSLLCLCLGIKELIYSKEYHSEGKKRLAVSSLLVGILVCLSAILSFTNII